MPKGRANLGPYYHIFKKESAIKISKEDYSMIVITFFRVMMTRMIKFGEIYRLPEKLGVMGIFKSPTNYPMYDYGYYKKTGIKNFLLNKHSQGYFARFKWFNQTQVTGTWDTYELISLYSYVPAREIKRMLTKEIKENNTIVNYTDIDDIRIYFR